MKMQIVSIIQFYATNQERIILQNKKSELKFHQQLDKTCAIEYRYPVNQHRSKPTAEGYCFLVCSVSSVVYQV